MEATDGGGSVAEEKNRGIKWKTIWRLNGRTKWGGSCERSEGEGRLEARGGEWGKSKDVVEHASGKVHSGRGEGGCERGRPRIIIIISFHTLLKATDTDGGPPWGQSLDERKKGDKKPKFSWSFTILSVVMLSWVYHSGWSYSVLALSTWKSICFPGIISLDGSIVSSRWWSGRRWAVLALWSETLVLPGIIIHVGASFCQCLHSWNIVVLAPGTNCNWCWANYLVNEVMKVNCVTKWLSLPASYIFMFSRGEEVLSIREFLVVTLASFVTIDFFVNDQVRNSNTEVECHPLVGRESVSKGHDTIDTQGGNSSRVTSCWLAGPGTAVVLYPTQPKLVSIYLPNKGRMNSWVSCALFAHAVERTRASGLEVSNVNHYSTEAHKESISVPTLRWHFLVNAAALKAKNKNLLNSLGIKGPFPLVMKLGSPQGAVNIMLEMKPNVP